MKRASIVLAIPSSDAVSSPESWRELYRLDGSELKRTFALQPPSAPGTVAWVGTEESVSTAAWQDQQLVIVTKSVFVETRGGDVNATIGRPGPVHSIYSRTPPGR